MNVIQTLEGYKQRKQGIYNNKDLSYQGQQKELAKLAQDEAQFKAEAYRDLQDGWRFIRAKAEKLSERKAQAQEEAAKQWDYNRLLYNARAIESEVKNANSLDDVKKRYTEVMRGNDKHLRRAWAENLQAVAVSKWRESRDTNDLGRMARADLEKLTSTAELEAIAKDEDAITRQGVELYKTTQAVARHYSSGDIFGGGGEFSKLLDGVTVTETVDVSTLATVQSIDFARG